MSWDEHIMLIAHTVNQFGRKVKVGLCVKGRVLCVLGAESWEAHEKRAGLAVCVPERGRQRGEEAIEAWSNLVLFFFLLEFGAPAGARWRPCSVSIGTCCPRTAALSSTACCAAGDRQHRQQQHVRGAARHGAGVLCVLWCTIFSL